MSCCIPVCSSAVENVSCRGQLSVAPEVSRYRNNNNNPYSRCPVLQAVIWYQPPSGFALDELVAVLLLACIEELAFAVAILPSTEKEVACTLCAA